jgi:FdhE protein
MTAFPWDRRIERAEELAGTHTAASEIMRFYAEIARAQKAIYEKLLATQPRHSNVSLLLPHFPPMLSLVKRAGPTPLARVADDLARNPAQWQGLLGSQEAGEEKRFFSRALLQPYFEYQASQSDIAVGAVQPACPFCAEPPQVAVMRGEGDGGKRSLICSLCSTEWDFRRLLCPHCGEENERNLPVYTAEEFPHVRIEACDTCHTYIKSIDLTKNGLAVPVVDELAAIPLDVWAEERGYGKLQCSLLGT